MKWKDEAGKSRWRKEMSCEMLPLNQRERWNETENLRNLPSLCTNAGYLQLSADGIVYKTATHYLSAGLWRSSAIYLSLSLTNVGLHRYVSLQLNQLCYNSTRGHPCKLTPFWSAVSIFQPLKVNFILLHTGLRCAILTYLPPNPNSHNRIV